MEVCLVDGSPEGWECAEGCPVRLLGEQSGERPGQHKQKRLTRIEDKFFGAHKEKDVKAAYGDSGTAARFFKTFSEEENLNLFTRTDTRAEVLEGDCLEVLRLHEDNSFESAVTDPPYGLSKEPDIAEVLTKWLAGEDYRHRGGGFMGKSWDSFVPGPSIWREVYRVLKPGAFMLVFAGTRTQDLMTISLRFAGFNVIDTIQWIYGSGFPKSHNVQKALEKLGEHEAAEQFAGYGSALKPSHEPIILVRKPLSESSISRNVLEHGTGAINVDGARISSELPEGRLRHGGGKHSEHINQLDPNKRNAMPSGRFPANLLLSHSPECVRIGEKRVKSQSGSATPGNGNKTFCGTDMGSRSEIPIYADPDGKETVAAYECAEGCPADELGQEARFFQQFTPDTGAGFVYQSKASKKDRSSNGAVANTHPTAKPTALLQYLARLICPPGGTVLDPFLGSGSTAVACLRENFNCIGIEQDPEYVSIARARIEAERNM